MSSAPEGTGGWLEPPPAEGVRLDWPAIPRQVRLAVEQRLGSAVATAVSQPTGFSPGVASRLRLADGSRVFVKAVGPVPNPGTPSMHRREAGIVALCLLLYRLLASCGHMMMLIRDGLCWCSRTWMASTRPNPGTKVNSTVF
ncbi:MAG TPA: hypothetical protein VGE45_07390 [Chloroflexia bacterium]